MRKSKSIIMLLLVVITIVSIAAIPVSASTYIGYETKNEGGFLGIGATKYKYYAYFDGNMIRAWYGAPLSHIPYHTKGTGDEQLSVSQEQSFGWQTTVSYNNAIGGNFGISELVSLSAEKGYGLTTGVSFSSTAVKTYTKTIASSAKTGFYMLAPSQTEKKCHWTKYKVSDSSYIGTGTYYMPYGNASVTCLYSSDNSSWSLYS